MEGFKGGEGAIRQFRTTITDVLRVAGHNGTVMARYSAKLTKARARRRVLRCYASVSEYHITDVLGVAGHNRIVMAR